MGLRKPSSGQLDGTPDSPQRTAVETQPFATGTAFSDSGHSGGGLQAASAAPNRHSVTIVNESMSLGCIREGSSRDNPLRDRTYDFS